MDPLIIRQELHRYIDDADDESVEAMYANIKNEVSEPYVWYKDEELVAELERRSDDLKSGRVEGVPWEDVKARLLKRSKKNDL